ncbi:hypothetical protein DS745_03095 [Anaerobacillus alkaliphilus]|uniref:DUF4367 domain-containing protein n=1 Tax=Anaerobacillus alkaliphilus TaxID=1548597 RepID=A0A4V1LGY8_9BACI|nr:hypothetical protein [Anaerobacillus alkaliphilus]RXJ04385.1 hypothetical protein DS745_03095 [Anaerobacillus alkaliphilus]
MNKRLGFMLILMVIIIIGCTRDETTIKKAIEQLDYKVYVPSYIPAELELETAVLKDGLILISYQNVDGTKYVEFSQDATSRALNIEGLLTFKKSGEDPYERNATRRIQEIGPFVGVYDINEKLTSYSYEFIKPNLQSDSYPFYWISSVGIPEAEFLKIVSSLK